MYLMVNELNTFDLYQELTTPDRVVQVVHLRPHLYKHLAPAGSFYMQVQDTNGKKIKDSNALTAAEISSSNYFHGYIRFDISVTLRPETTYRFALMSTGYTFSESAFIGWCNDWDYFRYTRDYTPAYDAQCPLDLEIWDKRLTEKRVG